MGCLCSKHSGHHYSPSAKLSSRNLTSYQQACQSDPDLKSYDPYSKLPTGCLCRRSKHSGHHYSPPAKLSRRNLTSYQHACHSDPDLKSFDSTQQDRTTQVINSFAADAKAHSLSVNSASQAIRNLEAMNGDVVKFILKCESDITNNHELSSLVKDFFHLSNLTIDFCLSLENCLKNAANSSSIFQNTIDQYDKDNDHVKTLESFKEFKALEAPFSPQFFEKFQNVLKQQQSMQKKLERQMVKVTNDSDAAKARKQLTNMIFVVTFSILMICTVVVSTVGTPAVVVALAVVAPTVTGTAWTWIDTLWKEYEMKLKGDKELVGTMPICNNLVIEELKSIKALVDKFGDQKKDLVEKAEIAIKEDEKVAVATAVEEMRKIINDFGKTMDGLSDGTKKIQRDLDNAKNLIIDNLSKKTMCYHS